MELLKEQQNKILDRQMRENVLRRQSQTNGKLIIQRHIGGETGSNSTSVVDEFGTAPDTARAQGSGMDAETSMREHAELRRQEQTSQSFGQDYKKEQNKIMSSFLSPKAEVHTISSDEEPLDSQGQEVFARQQQPQSPPSLPAPPHKDEIDFTGNMDFWDSQTVYYLKYQLFLRNIRFKEEDKMKGKDYKPYLRDFIQDEIVQGGWNDPVSDEMLNAGVNATTCLAFQTLKTQTFKLSNFRARNSAGIRTFNLDAFQTFKLCKLSIFRTLKLSNSQTFDL